MLGAQANNRNLIWFGWTSLKLEAILFSLLVFATVAFSRDFAKLHLRLSAQPPYLLIPFDVSTDSPFVTQALLPGIPIYATEIALALILVCIGLRRWREKNFEFKRTPLNWWVGLWTLVGLGAMVVGLLSSANVLLVLRDLSIIYYVIWVFIVLELCTNWTMFRLLSAAFIAGTVLRILIANWYYIFQVNFHPASGLYWPHFNRYLSGINGAYILIVLILGMAVWRLASQKQRRFVFVFLSLATFTLILTQQRSLFIALLLGWGAICIGARIFGILRPLGLPWILIGGFLAGILLWVVRVGVGPATPAPFLGPAKYLLTKTLLTSEEGVGTTSFRRDAWQEAWKRFLTNPILGEGFGKPFVFYDTSQNKWWTQDVRPHNTYLTILYKTGLVGMAVFIVLHVAFYRTVNQALRQRMPPANLVCLLALTGAMIGLQAYGFFNLLLESPFMALVYWSLIGVTLTLPKLAESSDCAMA